MEWWAGGKVDLDGCEWAGMDEAHYQRGGKQAGQIMNAGKLHLTRHQHRQGMEVGSADRVETGGNGKSMSLSHSQVNLIGPSGVK